MGIFTGVRRTSPLRRDYTVILVAWDKRGVLETGVNHKIQGAGLDMTGLGMAEVETRVDMPSFEMTGVDTTGVETRVDMPGVEMTGLI